jgi:hypothetical protein
MKGMTDKMGKLSTKYGPKIGDLTKSAGTAVKTPGFKKWGTRAAIGLGAIGAVTLGVAGLDGLMDSGAAFSGGEAFSGGDFGGGDMGGDFSGGGDMGGGDVGGGDYDVTGDGVVDQTDVNANFAQLAMEQQGQENALMLLDPVGTQYEVVSSNSLI